MRLLPQHLPSAIFLAALLSTTSLAIAAAPPAKTYAAALPAHVDKKGKSIWIKTTAKIANLEIERKNKIARVASSEYNAVRKEQALVTVNKKIDRAIQRYKDKGNTYFRRRGFPAPWAKTLPSGKTEKKAIAEAKPINSTKNKTNKASAAPPQEQASHHQPTNQSSTIKVEKPQQTTAASNTSGAHTAKGVKIIAPRISRKQNANTSQYKKLSSKSPTTNKESAYSLLYISGMVLLSFPFVIGLIIYLIKVKKLTPKGRWTGGAMLGGCGCLTLVALGVLGMFLATGLTDQSSESDKKSDSNTSTPSLSDSATEHDNWKAKRDKRNSMITVDEKNIFEEKIDSTRPQTFNCSPILTLYTFPDTASTGERVTVKQANVPTSMIPKGYSLLATYDISIGNRGALGAPINIDFTHKKLGPDYNMVAAYWNAKTGEWAPLSTQRISNTITCVRTKHLCTIALGYVKNLFTSSYMTRKTEHFTISIPKSANLALSKFYGSNKKALKVMDAMRYTDTSLSVSKRFLQGETRLSMDILEDVLEHLWKKYEPYNPPKMIRVNLDPAALNPRFNPKLWSYSITLPTNNYTSFDGMCFDVAHELFHAVQNNASGMYSHKMYRSWLTLVEATAEYAAGRVAWRQASGANFQTHGLKVDYKKIAVMMGPGISRDFIDVNLNYFSEDDSSPWNQHQYQLSHFLDFMFRQNPGLGGFNAFWSDFKNNAYWTGSYMAPYKAFTKRGNREFREIYADFCAFLLLSPRSPVKLSSKSYPSYPETIPLEGACSNTLKLRDAYTARYRGFKLDSKATEALSVTFNLKTSKSDFAEVRFYATPKDYTSSTQVGKARIGAKPRSVNVVMKPNEYCYMIVDAVSNAGEMIPIQINASVLTMNIVAERDADNPLRFRFKLNHPEFATESGLIYKWGIEGKNRTINTPEITYDFKSAGTFPIEVAVLNMSDKSVRYGIARTKVVVPTFLKVELLDSETNARIPATVSLITSDGKGKQHSLSAPSGMATFGPILPGKRTFGFALSASGYHSRKFKRTMSLNTRPLYVFSVKMRKIEEKLIKKKTEQTKPKSQTVETEKENKKTELRIPKTNKRDAIAAINKWRNKRIQELRKEGNAKLDKIKSELDKVVGKSIEWNCKSCGFSGKLWWNSGSWDCPGCHKTILMPSEYPTSHGIHKKVKAHYRKLMAQVHKQANNAIKAVNERK